MSQPQTLGNGQSTSWEKFWYVLGCIYFGAAYLSKVPAKKALSEYGLVVMTGAEKFWYVVQCVFFGSGYFSKIITKKALSEVRFAAPQAAYVPPAGQSPYAP